MSYNKIGAALLTRPALTGVVTLVVPADGAVKAWLGVARWQRLTVSASESYMRAVTAVSETITQHRLL